MKNKLKFLTLLLVLVSSASFAQVGIGNTDPKATLDVNKTSYTVGEQAGIAVTQLTGAQILAMATSGLKAGTLVYATTTSGAIDSTGFWHYTGSAWAKVGAGTTPTASVVTNTAATYSILGTEDIILSNAISNCTMTLPASAAVGKRIVIANKNGSGGLVSITVASGGSFWNGDGYAIAVNNSNVFTYTTSGWINEAIGLN